MAKTKIAVLWGLLIAMMVVCAGIYAALKAREINPYIGSTGTYVETVQPNGEASAVVADNVVTVDDLKRLYIDEYKFIFSVIFPISSDMGNICIISIRFAEFMLSIFALDIIYNFRRRK